MIKKVILIILSGAIIFIISLLISFLYNKLGNSQKIINLDSDRIQGSKEVKWKKFSFVKEFELPEFFNKKWPQEIKTDSKNNLYVLDIADYEIIKFDSTGKFIKKWGRRGHGPGEFSGAVRFFIDKRDKIWIKDNGNNRLLIYDDNGNLMNIIKFTFPINNNTIVIDDSTFIVPQELNSPFITKYNYNGKKIMSFGTHPSVSYLLNQGRCLLDHKNNIYYSYDFSNIIQIYNCNGELIHILDGPVKIPLPYESLKNPNYELTGYEKFATLYMCVDNHYLFVLFSGISPAHPEVVSRHISPVESDIIHVYDIEKQKYLYTFKIPILAKYIHVKGNDFYCVSESPDANVIKYKMY